MTVKSIISSNILHETLTFDERNLPWINKKLKHSVLEENVICKKYVKKTKTQIFDKVKFINWNSLTEFVNWN